MERRLARYFDTLAACQQGWQASGGDGRPYGRGAAVAAAIAQMEQAVADGGRLFFIGNGGSAAIASHCAIDYTKNGGLPALALNDGAALTCLGNDYGYAHVFEKQIAAHLRHGDVLVAISSSGASANILAAAEVARSRGGGVITLSGFAADNPLRGCGGLNFWVDSRDYGFVELTHQAILHAILDLKTGWQ